MRRFILPFLRPEEPDYPEELDVDPLSDDVYYQAMNLFGIAGIHHPAQDVVEYRWPGAGFYLITNGVHKRDVWVVLNAEGELWLRMNLPPHACFEEEPCSSSS